MHRPRLLGWKDSNCYHVISRTAGRSFLFDPAEREMFGAMLNKSARFCGVQVLTWCCLSNHFHLLIRIDNTAADALRQRLRSDFGTFLRHLRILYSAPKVKEIAAEIAELRKAGHNATADASVERYLSRIGDLSVFVKELKQRYSIWFNAHHDRDGTLWSSRFRSVLVENTTDALRTVACYIDLNPVRAGIVNDPKDYRWCGYAQAIGGNRSAQLGLRQVLHCNDRDSDSRSSVPNWQRAAEDYRLLLFGNVSALEDGAGGVTRRGADIAAIKEVLRAGGRLSAGELFRLRIRHLTEGTALGSATFLENLARKRPQQISSRRQQALTPIRHLEEDKVFSLRNLKATF